MNWITNKWSSTTNALGKTHIWKSTHLPRNQKNNNVKWKFKPNTMFNGGKKKDNKHPIMFQAWDKTPKP
jgi:hypothetical protein